MSYKALIDSKLNLAFNKLKDLAEDVTFVRKTVDGFDFSTGLPSIQTDPNLEVKAVVIKSKKEKSADKIQLLFKSNSAEPFSSFSTVTVNGETYQIGDVLAERQYITLLEAFKEA